MQGNSHYVYNNVNYQSSTCDKYVLFDIYKKSHETRKIPNV